MKTILNAASLAVFAFATLGLASAQGIGMTIRGGAIVPDRDDEWDVGGGIELGIVFWGSPNIGLWLGGGVQGWSMPTETSLLGDGGWFTVDGRVSVAPFGASLLIWTPLGDGFALQAEGGLRYAVVDSEATVETWQPYSKGYMAVYEDPIDIDDTVLAVASLQLEYTVDMWSIGLGAGFQWDLARPDQKLRGQTIAETAFDAAFFFLSAGIAF